VDFCIHDLFDFLGTLSRLAGGVRLP
jgi:hypothetical protein